MVELGDSLENPLKIKKKKKIKANSLIDDGHSDIITTNEVQVASLGNEAPMFVLFEHAVGYALFRLKQYEEVGAALMAEQLRDNLTDFTKFCMNVHLIAFSPFKSAKNALENINYISEGMVHEDLYLFLDTHLPKIKKVLLAVSDSKLANSLSENKELNINCIYSGLVPDLMRGIRQHFTKFFKDFKQSSTTSLQLDESKGIKAQLGLAHSYSRAKIKFNVNRVDNMIVQCIAILDQLDKDINKFCMRLREWYSYHFPELYKLVPENLLYAKVVKCVGDRKDLFQASDPQTIAAIRENLEILLPDSAIVDAIIKIAKSSMGMDISPLDLNMVIKFTDRVVALGELRKALANYLNQKMKCVAPNLAELLGDTVSARLISHAGSLSNLAKCPASTIQILGAEKALFRALKSRSGNTPKYGLLFHSAFISKAGPTNKGKVSRYLANKCAIASRIDCFSDFACPIYGQFLKAQVENRIRFLETGEEPIKNDDLMSQAKEKAHDYIEAAKHLQEAVSSSSVKKVKKKKKKIQEEIPLMNGDAEININHTSSFADQLDQVENAMEVTSGKKKKNKKRKIVQDDGNNDLDIMLNGSSNFSTFTETKLERVTVNEQELISTQVGLKPPKKKKKKLINSV